ncbi:MAG: hypothetical protein IKO40_01275 [Kiritimatiellae bacterium]|nr:hypothetical protein [Kiritimatiellia bacterium]
MPTAKNFSQIAHSPFRREAVHQMLSDFSGFGSGDALRELFHACMGMSMREFRAKARLSLP